MKYTVREKILQLEIVKCKMHGNVKLVRYKVYAKKKKKVIQTFIYYEEKKIKW